LANIFSEQYFRRGDVNGAEEDWHGRRASVFVSQLPISSWHEIIGDPTIADAICDRIIHNAHRIELKGDSVRKIYAKH
jgi:DNA replication protein DnaC